MSSDSTTDTGLGNGRQWSALPTEGAPLEWTIDADKGRIQGPLDLEFLRGKRLSLILQEGQQALLIDNGQLRAVYLDGAHYLEIGRGKRQIKPSSQLVFLAMEEPLQLRWPRGNPLRWGAATHQTLIGSCNLAVVRPAHFFGTFLQGQMSPDPGFTERLIDQMIRGLFEVILSGGPTPDTTLGASEIQARLTRLSPDDLNDDLNACGLACTHLAVYTSAPPIEEDLPVDVSVADPTASH